MKRLIIKIDEALCNGCGNCITGCAEGALALIDGKARLVKEQFCDGMGDCIGTCPTGALTMEERESDSFDEEQTRSHVAKTRGQEGLQQFEQAAQAHQAKSGGAGHSGCPGSAPRQFPAGGGCPGSAMRSLSPRTDPVDSGEDQPSQLGHWPVQLMLVPPSAPYLQNADLLICADCVPFALAGFHTRYLAGKVVLVGCPKLDDNDFYQKKLQEIFQIANPRRVTVLRMEVPCCGGIAQAATQARAGAGGTFPLEIHTVGIQGAVVRKATAA